MVSLRTHGNLDYPLAVMFFLAPMIFPLGLLASSACNVAGAFSLILGLLTVYPLRINQLIEFPLHWTTDFVPGLLYGAAPWLFGFSQDTVALRLFLSLGVVSTVAALLTNARHLPARHGHARGHH